LEEKNENNLNPEESSADAQGGRIFYIFPLLLLILLCVGFAELKSDLNIVSGNNESENSPGKKEPSINLSALLGGEEFSQNLRDTVYTDKNVWLELRIDRQMVYEHFKDGHVKTYPVSTGNKALNKGIESRPGLFAIFHKEELHLSSQFEDAKMFYYQPFNMGIGFHGLAGTGYYGALGIRPSSHGCIRMRTEDAKVLFKDTDVGTLVLVHRGMTARVVAFAPEGFKNDADYTKDDYFNMLAYNLSSICEGKYFINPPKRFILDGTIVPKIGINVRSSDEIPPRQILPVYINNFPTGNDRLKDTKYVSSEDIKDTPVANNIDIVKQDNERSVMEVSPDVVKKYVYNPIGILPVFPPSK